jgi:V/A-type H+-transporting ATPase subunit G/H
MEDIIKRLLTVEREAEGRVQQADAARRKMIQEALDQARTAETEFEKQADARRKPFLATAEEGAHRRIEELEAAAAARQRLLREQAAGNEEAAVLGTLALILGER